MAEIVKVAEGQRVEFYGAEETVNPSCGESVRGGRFYCVPCEVDGLGTALGQVPPLPAHAGHALAWVCGDHGLERP